MPDDQGRKHSRGYLARKRILRRLALLDVVELRKVPRSTIAVLTWRDVVDLIELRHRMRSLEKQGIAFALARFGLRTGRVLDQLIAKITMQRMKRTFSFRIRKSEKR
jgi:hypothetical protein